MSKRHGRRVECDTDVVGGRAEPDFPAHPYRTARDECDAASKSCSGTSEKRCRAQRFLIKQLGNRSRFVTLLRRVGLVGFVTSIAALRRSASCQPASPKARARSSREPRKAILMMSAASRPAGLSHSDRLYSKLQPEFAIDCPWLCRIERWRIVGKTADSHLQLSSFRQADLRLWQPNDRQPCGEQTGRADRTHRVFGEDLSACPGQPMKDREKGPASACATDHESSCADRSPQGCP